MIRRIVLVFLILVLSVLVFLMITDRPETPQLDLPMNGGIVQAGGFAMLATIYSIGGFLVGGGTVYLYAKATNQEIEWRRVDLIRIIQRAFFGTPYRSRNI